MKGKKIYYIFITLAFVIMATFNACKPKPEPEPNTPGSVSVTTSSVSNITETSAKCGGTVTASGYSVGSCGLCYSELPNPTINSYITSDQVGTGTFTSTMSGLEPGTKYYVRAYATTSSGVLYGEQKEFTTLGNNGGDDDDDDNGGGNGGDDDNGTINEHEYVDLGLPSGLKWATCNVGASSPEDYGDYFAWGETSPKAEYTSENSITYGEQMSDISGNAQYDAATANWGGSWRMPTEDELWELFDHCEWEWTQVNGVNGSKVVGPNGSCILLPAAGYRYGSALDDAGNGGLYWSSTPHDDGYYDAYVLFFGNGYEYEVNHYRSYGRTVRPVSD